MSFNYSDEDWDGKFDIHPDEMERKILQVLSDRGGSILGKPALMRAMGLPGWASNRVFFTRPYNSLLKKGLTFRAGNALVLDVQKYEQMLRENKPVWPPPPPVDLLPDLAIAALQNLISDYRGIVSQWQRMRDELIELRGVRDELKECTEIREKLRGLFNAD